MITTLFNQNDFLVKQGDVSVTFSDLDSYVYTIPSDKRGGFAVDTNQIDKNIISILNMNIVYDFIINSDYAKHPVFKNINDTMEQQEIVLDGDYIKQLDLNEEEFTRQFKHFLMKKEYVKEIKNVLSQTLNSEDLEMMAKERFLILKKSLTVPAKRSLSVISLNKLTYSQEDAIEVLSEIINNTKTFEEAATAYSDDPSVKSNKGNWHEFRKNDFNYPFKEVVFSSQTTTGLIHNVFDYKDHYYLVNVDSIIDEEEPKFSDYSEEIKESLKGGIVEQKFQNIINTKAISKPEVNAENAAHIFERYKIFIKE